MVMNKDSVNDSQVTIKLKNKVSKLEYFDANINAWMNVSNYTQNSSGTEFSMHLTSWNGILYCPTWQSTGLNDVQTLSNQANVHAYPNPFHSTINIEYDLFEDQTVELTITDLLGKPVRSLIKKFKSKGPNTETIDTSNLHNGIYLYSLMMKNSSYTGRIIHQ